MGVHLALLTLPEVQSVAYVLPFVEGAADRHPKPLLGVCHERSIWIMTGPSLLRFPCHLRHRGHIYDEWDFAYGEVSEPYTTGVAWPTSARPTTNEWAKCRCLPGKCNCNGAACRRALDGLAPYIILQPAILDRIASSSSGDRNTRRARKNAI